MRTEKDTLGEVSVPDDALYGAQTQRAIENYPISGLREHPAFIRAFVVLKKAAALANRELGAMEPRLADAIIAACDRILGNLGVYKPIHPNDHVNMSQSTNDVVPTAIRISAVHLLGLLIPAVERLGKALD